MIGLRIATRGEPKVIESDAWTFAEIRISIRPRVLTWSDWPIPQEGGLARVFYDNDWVERKTFNQSATKLLGHLAPGDGIFGPALVLKTEDSKLVGLAEADLFIVAAAMVFTERKALTGRKRNV